jgi:hypothetical protein
MTVKWKELVDADGKSGKLNTCKKEKVKGESPQHLPLQLRSQKVSTRN